MTDLAGMTDALIKADEAKLVGLVEAALKDDGDPREILNNGLIKGMDVVGDKMESGDMYIPEVLMSAKCMSAALELLKPLLKESEIDGPKKVIIGTVKGDLHDIGKNLVQMMLGSSGFEVIDLGVDADPDAFVQATKEHRAEIVALSALLTTTMPMMKQTVDALVESGLRDTIKIIIGGAPVTQSFADQIGADGFAADAGSATKLAKKLVN
jgi:5-methyltetrahydrofolate--homocysteine methyltransferase